MQRYALVTGLSNEEPAIIELLHEGPQRPLGVGLNLPKHGRNYPYKAIEVVPGSLNHYTAFLELQRATDCPTFRQSLTVIGSAFLIDYSPLQFDA